jgi:magnesium-transporting ATPase (P-type)
MEDQIGPDRAPKTEIEKLSEEIEKMEFEEKKAEIKDKKLAATASLIANLVAVLSFIAWSFLIKADYNGKYLLIPTVISLLVSISLFIVFYKCSINNCELRKYFKSNFYALIVVFTLLIVFSIFKI